MSIMPWGRARFVGRHRNMVVGLLLILAGVAAVAARSDLPEPPLQDFQTVRSRDFADLPLDRLDELYARLIDSLAITNGEALYQAYQAGQPIVHYVFTHGNSEAQLAVLEKTAAFIHTIPRYRNLPGRSVFGGVAEALEAGGGTSARLGEAIATRTASFDRLPLPSRAELDDYRIFPIKDGERLAITSGNAQQFGYLIAELTRLAAAATPPAGREQQWRAALGTVHDFAAHDTLRFYWLEMPGWHWAGAYPNVRARTLAKLDGEPKLKTRIFFRAFIDYDVHLFAIAADLVAAERTAPWLTRNRGDRAAVLDAYAIGLRALTARIDPGADGRGFRFDRGYWADNPVAAYAKCVDPLPPTKECRWDGYVSDVSHAQRWPFWLESFAQAAPDKARRKQVEIWRQGLAHELGEHVLRADAAGRPLMSNFMDGHDGWYLFTGAEPGGSGHRPSSLTGWSMRYGAWASLAPLDKRIADAHRRFCQVIASEDPADITFRTVRYGAPGPDPRNGFASAKDEYGRTSSYYLPCRIAVAMGQY